jgi:hypothetical protein
MVSAVDSLGNSLPSSLYSQAQAAADDEKKEKAETVDAPKAPEVPKAIDSEKAKIKKKKKKAKKKAPSVSDGVGLAFQKAISDLPFRPTKAVRILKTEPLILKSEQVYDVGSFQLLSSGKTIKGEVMVALSGMHALNILSWLNLSRPIIKYCILVNVTDADQKFWTQALEIIRNTNTRQEAYEGLCKVLSSESSKKPDPILLSQKFRWEKEIPQGKSWLSSKAQYDAVQSVLKSNGAVFKMMDLADKNASQWLSNKLAQLKRQIGVLYLSNAREYCEAFKILPLYQKSIEVLLGACSKDALIMDTEIRPGGSVPFSQKVSDVYPLIPRILTRSDITSVEKFFPASPAFVKGEKKDRPRTEIDIEFDRRTLSHKGPMQNLFMPFFTIKDEIKG